VNANFDRYMQNLKAKVWKMLNLWL
jgi:hypothetical protein